MTYFEPREFAFPDEIPDDVTRVRDREGFVAERAPLRGWRWMGMVSSEKVQRGWEWDEDGGAKFPVTEIPAP